MNGKEIAFLPMGKSMLECADTAMIMNTNEKEIRV